MSERLLFTTHACIAKAEIADGAASVEVLQRGYFYGADQLPDGSILAAERTTPALEPNSPTTFWLFKDDSVEAWPNDNIQNVHQLTSNSSTVYVCDTAHDRVVVFPLDNLRESAEEILLSDANSDTLHVNSVSPYNSHILINLHRRGEWPSHVAVVNPDRTGTLLALNHAGTHNFEILGDHCYYNASQEGRVLRGKINSNDPWAYVEVGGHPKGMSFNSDGSRLYVGVSGVASRSERPLVESHVAIIKVDGFYLLDIIPLRSPEGSALGNLNEVRVLR